MKRATTIVWAIVLGVGVGCASSKPPAPTFVHYDQAADHPKEEDDELTIGAAFETLRRDDKLAAAIIGYASSEGDAQRNKELSFRRAAGVRDAIARHGIAASRLTVAARGISDPLASNDTEEGRALNRRVEIFFYYPDRGDLRAQYGASIELEGSASASAK